MRRIASRRSGKREFFQLVVLISWAITALWISFSYVLALLDKNTNEAVTLALVGESFGVSLAYAIYQATIKTSLNKKGLAIRKDGTVYQVGEIAAQNNEEESNNL